ncbi:MAG TPA: c-type cytochrome [Blastocatellia bacterium]|nr:c-type cytochrome [Blastocatellia bacterium]
MKSSRLVLVLSLVAVATVAAHAGKPANTSRFIGDSSENARSPGPQQDDKPAEQANKNIQTLASLPNSQLIIVMHFMRTSLGVRCDYCHVAENGKYWMDDKPPKQIARRMIEMTSEINKASFGGRQVVTCNTCHRGQPKPIAVPAIGQGVFANTTREDPATKQPDPLPSVDQVLDKYFQVLGGKAAAQKITSRVIKLSWLRPKLVNGGTPNAAMIARGDKWAMEIYQKAPNKYLAVITSPNGIIQQGFNGTSGWVKSPQGQREMNNAELARFARQADLLGDFALKDQYSLMTVTGREKIDDREAYVVEAQPKASGGAPAPSTTGSARRTEKLFFDIQSGLLVRRTVLTPTALGLDPEQTDFKDYTEVDGVKLPFTIIVSYLDDSHLGTTKKYIDVKQNVPIDDAKFEAPGK